METDLDRLRMVQARITRAAADFGRDPHDIRLVCVSKTISADRLEPLLEAGFRDFAENRVQEAQEKWPTFRKAYPDIDLKLIGPLQTNKVRDAIKLFDAIETIDRERLIQELARQLTKLHFEDQLERKLRLYVQVNIGEEPQKAGVAPADVDNFLGLCAKLSLSITGLMCIPPVNQLASPFFAQLAIMGKRNNLKNLSMGMTSDFEAAIQMGATEVRVGSAIFGDR